MSGRTSNPSPQPRKVPNLRDIRFYMKPEYGQSHALVIGINRYQNASPLGYAVNDARAVYAKLVETFEFPPENVTLLLDEEATVGAIRQQFLRFCDQDQVGLDDRIVVFFAGHGTTRRGTRGEVGYLVPYDADLDDLSSLLRWDDLTRNSEMIPAKHMLFIMDACYGGLAVTRALNSGSARFLRDMLKRFSRQVLTAGKADETVADAGGPLPGHSVFTGHLLQGLDGKAATPEGLITASGLMAYVYSHVSVDAGSFQTPHFGHVDGDGDFILQMPAIVDSSEATNSDALFVVPYPEEVDTRSDLRSKVARVKQILGDPERVIELHDFVIDEVRRLLAATGQDGFTPGAPFSDHELLTRLARYEACTRDLAIIEACIAYWATPSHRQILRKALARSVDRLEALSGLSLWLNLRWYPLVLQVYSAGIAAVEARRYDTLADLFLAEIRSAEEVRPCFRVVADAVLEFARADVFKRVPGHERHYTPMSEYLFKRLQPQLDDALFVGMSYESAFDEFECLLALASAHARQREEESAWGPIGRFGWKHGRHRKAPLESVVEQAKTEGVRWAPLQAGLFDGDLDGFLHAAGEYKKMIDKLHWY